MFENNLWQMEPVGRRENTIQEKNIAFFFSRHALSAWSTGKTDALKTVLLRLCGTDSLKE